MFGTWQGEDQLSLTFPLQIFSIKYAHVEHVVCTGHWLSQTLVAYLRVESDAQLWTKEESSSDSNTGKVFQNEVGLMEGRTFLANKTNKQFFH